MPRKRWRATVPTTPIEASAQVIDPQDARRRAAFDRAWLLLSTTIPTSDVLASYLADVMDEPL